MLNHTFAQNRDERIVSLRHEYGFAQHTHFQDKHQDRIGTGILAP